MLDIEDYPTICQDSSTYIKLLNYLELHLDLLPSVVSTTQERRAFFTQKRPGKVDIDIPRVKLNCV